MLNKKTLFSALLAALFLTFHPIRSFGQTIINTFPFTETFDTFPACGTTCATVCPLLSGWTNLTIDNTDWLVDANGTPSSNTGPSADHTTGTGNYLYVEASSCLNNTAALTTPSLDLSGLTNFRMEFWYHMYGQSMGTLHIDVSNDGGVTYTDDVIPPITDNIDLWQKKVVNLDAYAGDTIIIRVRGVTGNDFYSDMAIDDFTFFFLHPNDAGVVSIDSPLTPLTPGVHPVAVSIKNFGTDTLTSLTVEWSVNGIQQAPYVWNGTLISEQVIQGLTLGTYNFPAGFSVIKAWTGLPNGQPDNDHSNDTLEITTCTALNGTYTIGGATPDFTSFTQAVNALVSCGISGPVIFNVAPSSGPYVEQITIPAITGASAANTITFNGNGEKITFSSTSSNDRHVILLDGADYVTLNNLIIDATGGGTYGWAVRLTNNADYNSITNCTIISETASTSSNYAGIVASGSPTSATTDGNNANFTLISGNTIIGGYYGITMIGNGSLNMATGNIIQNNTIQDFYYYGIYLDDQNGAVVSGNDLQRPTRTTATTIYMLYLSGASSQNNLIEKNRLHTISGTNSTFYGIYFSGADAPMGMPNRVINNMIYNLRQSGSIYAIYNSSSNGAYYYHNTIIIDDPVASTSLARGFYQLTTATDIEFKNNIVVVTRGGTGTKHCIYMGSTTSTIISDYNVFMVDTAAHNVGYFGGNFQTLANWQTANGNAYDQHSVFADPLFVNPVSDPTPTSADVNNVGDSLGIADDILGNPRSPVTPDPGAIEFTPPTLDAAISWVAPLPPVTTGPQTITVNIANSISSIPPISSVVLTYSDGITPVTETFSGLNILPGTSQDLSFSTSYNLTSLVTLRAWIETVNGAPDAISSNDTTAPQTLCASIAGVFTIDAGSPASSTNFQTFTAAVNALINCGISGPVTFNVVPGSGPYNEQIAIPQIIGASAANTITFNGNGDTLQATASSANRVLITLDGARHITFNNLVIRTLDATYGWGFLLTNQADSNTINSCIIDLSSANGSTGISDCNGIIASTSSTSSSSGGNTANNNQIINNTIIGGYYGIRLNGASATPLVGNVISGNTIQDFYSAGVYLLYTYQNRVTGNDISRPQRNSVSSTTYGIYASNVSATSFERNRIHHLYENALSLTGTLYAIYLTASDPAIGEENRFINNLIYGLNKFIGTLYGFYNSSSDNALYYHNTISLDDTSAVTTSTTRGFYQITTATGIDFRNNIISISRGGTGAKHCLYFSTTGSSITSNNNVLFMNASGGVSNHVGYYGGDFTTLADWRTANLGAYDQQSSDANPQYNNPAAGDFQPTNSAINNLGTGVGVTEDINLTPRNPSFPDPGAYEFTPVGLDAAITWVSPVPPLSAGLHPVKVNINNTQTTAITSLDLSYTDGVTTVSESFDGLNIPAGGNQDFTFSTPYNLTGITSIYAYIDSVNGMMDDDRSNDTTSVQTICPGLSGTFTINAGSPPSTTNFPSFSSAVSALVSCGITGPVVFNVVPGSGPYTEQISIPQISGSSAVNTITFNGNGETIAFSSSNNSARHVIELNGADYITLNNLTINATGAGSYGFGIVLTNGADNNTITGCTVLTNNTSTSSNYAGIVATGSASSATTDGNNANNTLIANNTISGGYYGITLIGNGSSDMASGNHVINNQIHDFYYYGIYLDDQQGALVSGNTIQRPTRTTASTIYMIYLSGTASQSNFIEKNRLHNISGSSTTTYGIAFSSADAPSGMENKVVNNLIYDLRTSGSIYGIYNSGSDGAHYYHNTISLDDHTATSGTTRGFYQLTSASNIAFKNNIVSVTRSGSGTKHCIYLSTTTSTVASDYNVFYTDTTTQYIGYYNGNVASLPAWQTVNGGIYDQHSVFANPLFTNPASNLTPLNPAINNTATPLGITEDIFGTARDTVNPDAGAIEFTPVTTDAAVVAVANPQSDICGADSIPVVVVIQNLGTDTLGTSTITVFLSGALTDTLQGVTSVLPSLQKDTVMVGTFSLTQGGNLTLTAMVAASGDANASNDTLITQVTIFRTPDAPVLLPYNDTICRFSSTVISVMADSAYTYEWYDAPTGGNRLFTGSSFTTPVLDSSRTYYVEATTSVNYRVGPVDVSIGPSSNFNSLNVQGLYFDVYTTIVIDSFAVYPNAPGDVVVEISTPDNLTVIDTVRVTVSTTGRTMIPVGITVQPGSYRIDANGSTTGGLLRNSGGAVYPYEVPGVMAITGNSFDPVYYYYFYDWHITARGCPGSRTAATVFVDTLDAVNPSLNAVVSGRMVTFSDANFDPSATYMLNFGDGNQGNAPNIAYTYTADGTYTACLTASNSCSTDSSCVTLTVCENLAAGFSVTKNGLSATFTYNGSGTPVNYLWIFDGMDTSTAMQPQYTFAADGIYDVTLIVENLCGERDSLTISVAVCEPLDTDFNFTKDTSGLTVQFFSSVNGNPTGYLWQFGDGETSTDTDPTHTYSTAGNYTVVLTVTNVCGELDSTVKTVGACAPIVAEFTVRVDNNTTVTITNNSSGSGLVYSWNFGDGASSSETEPVHTYSTPGNYTITLTATDVCGATATSTRNVSITVGIGFSTAYEDLEVFPNPSEDIFLVRYTLSEFATVTLRVINHLGARIYENTLAQTAGEHAMPVDLSGHPAGTYFLELTSGKHKALKRIVLE
ncbi:MAG: hypothetical protein KatS3mg031_2100 [Chitinophagales bacterium]|nr:MAG: hypothetical protein KatS3mg031_2100 [Chitinophagales bacterium]